MKVGTADVTSGGVSVGTASYSIYETGEEATSNLGEKNMLEILNAQVRTNAMNAVRTAATQKPGKEKLRKEALTRITVEEFQTVQGDMARLEALIQKKVEELEKEAAAKAQSATPSTPTTPTSNPEQ